MTREELRHITDLCFTVPSAIRRFGEERTYHAEEIAEAKQIVMNMLEQEPFINKPCISSEVCEHDKKQALDNIRAEIVEEKECAYADFERYKVEYLGQDWEDAYDSLPQDDFRYGMERVIEIIDKYRQEG